jgi:hypothetical protein
VELPVNLVRAEDGGEHLADPVLGERLELQDVRDSAPAPALQRRQERMAAMELIRPIGDDDQGGQVDEASSEIVEQLPGGGVRPVDVLDDQQDGPVAGGERKERDDRLEETELRLAGVWRGFRQPVAGQRREELAELAERRAEGLPQAVVILLVEVVADRLDEGQVGQRDLSITGAA